MDQPAGKSVRGHLAARGGYGMAEHRAGSLVIFKRNQIHRREAPGKRVGDGGSEVADVRGADTGGNEVGGGEFVGQCPVVGDFDGTDAVHDDPLKFRPVHERHFDASRSVQVIAKRGSAGDENDLVARGVKCRRYEASGRAPCSEDDGFHDPVLV